MIKHNLHFQQAVVIKVTHFVLKKKGATEYTWNLNLHNLWS